MERLIFSTTDGAHGDGLDLKAKGRKRGVKTGTAGPSRGKRTVLFVVTVIIAALAVGGTLVLVLRPHMDEFTTYAIASFTGLFLVPLILLVIRTTPKKLALGRLDPGLLVSLAVYQIFGLWIIAYYFVNPHYFKKYDLGSWDYLGYVLMVGVYVAPVDFMTRRVIQHEMASAFGTWNGYWAGTVAWIVGHILEIVWLSELMGPAGSATFIVLSGLVTGLLYMKYKNVIALMLGHWTINIVISLVTSSLPLKGT